MSAFSPTFFAYSLFAMISISVQTAEVFYSDDFNSLTGWTTTGQVDIPTDLWACNQLDTLSSTTNCVRLTGPASIGRSFDIANYHLITVELDARESGGAATDWCRLQYTSTTGTRTANIIQGSATVAEFDWTFTIPDSDLPGNTITISLINTYSNGFICYFDNLNVFGTPITLSPTFPPTATTAAPTYNPSISPTSIPSESPSESPTRLPTESPTDSPVVSTTNAPSAPPTENAANPSLSATEPPTLQPTNDDNESGVDDTTSTEQTDEDTDSNGQKIESANDANSSTGTLWYIIGAFSGGLCIAGIVGISVYGCLRRKRTRGKSEGGSDGPSGEPDHKEVVDLGRVVSISSRSQFSDEEKTDGPMDENTAASVVMNFAQKPLTEWQWMDVLAWIVSLESGRFAEYEAKLKQSLREEEIRGDLLDDVDINVIKGWGVVRFEDKRDLLQHIERLIISGSGGDGVGREEEGDSEEEAECEDMYRNKEEQQVQTPTMNEMVSITQTPNVLHSDGGDDDSDEDDAMTPHTNQGIAGVNTAQ